MKICTLASSSKGNCSIVYTENTKILIDCGITLKELELKLTHLNIEAKDLDGVIVTHEHIDHTKGLAGLCKKYDIPIYCHEDALYGIIKRSNKLTISNFIFFNLLPFEIGEFVIEPFILPHDVPICIGYNIYNEGKKISFATDLGHITNEIVHNFYDSKLVILEANHDIELLKANPHYPAILKNRILGKNGHLSNIVSAQVIKDLVDHNVKQIVLAHLSEENNTPELCYSTICTYLEQFGIVDGVQINIAIASPYQLSPVFVLK